MKMPLVVSTLSADSIRILLLGRDAIVRAGLHLLVECQPGLTVVAQAGEEAEALRLAQQEQPDIILLHENLDGPLGIGIISKLVLVQTPPRIILLTSTTDEQFHFQAVNMGAMGVVLAQLSPDVLYKAVEKVHAGEAWLDRSLIGSFIAQKSNGHLNAGFDPQAKKIGRLSGREREIISLVGEGLKNQQIADHLFLSEVTVRHHLTSIFKKLDVSDRLELVIYAYQNGLARLPE